ncbi:hypothetical protein MKX01_042419 [Papaver californicum]|nr:hypothetical protein MKX01_042419 [Papaver californicum]
MSVTQFAMIEELAFLIKDNLPCKHLVLSIEEVLVDFLLNDTSLDGVLKLKPMNPYNRLLLHRLADIFGFVHVSVGEGDDRHLILERCLESSVPPILVSDILWQHDEYPSPTESHQILRRKDTLPASKTSTLSTKSSLEEREAAYLAARQRIFTEDDSEIKESVTPKPRNNPEVARRLIVTSLGLRVSSNSSGGVTSATHNGPDQKNQKLSGRENCVTHAAISERKSERKIQKKPAGSDKSVNGVPPPNGRMRQAPSEDNLKQEHLGAAKRLFANALRLNGKTDIAIPIDKGSEGNLKSLSMKDPKDDTWNHQARLHDMLHGPSSSALPRPNSVSLSVCSPCVELTIKLNSLQHETYEILFIQELPLEKPINTPTIISVAQFRPEKDHTLQLEAFSVAIEKLDPNSPRPKLQFVGSCRNPEDEQRLQKLKEKAIELNVEMDVEFYKNLLYRDLVRLLGGAIAGIHSMVDEHFGISIIEYMAAGAVPIAHNSAGPKMDTVLEEQGQQTGFLDQNVEEYADAILQLLKMSDAERLEMADAARRRSRRFSEERFYEDFKAASSPILSHSSLSKYEHRVPQVIHSYSEYEKWLYRNTILQKLCSVFYSRQDNFNPDVFFY